MTLIRGPTDLSEFFKALAENAFLGILCFERDGEATCVFANATAANLLEWPSDLDISSIKLASLYPEPSGGPDKIQRLAPELLDFEGLHQDVMVRKHTARGLLANVGLKHLAISGRRFLLVTLQDISVQKKLQRDLVAKQTAIKAAYEELLVQNTKLRELDMAKNRFIALTTHELRTPLAAMVTSAEVLKMKLYDSVEQMNEFVDMIYEQGQHLSELINDILDFAKIQAGKMDFFVTQQDLEPVVRGQVEKLAGMAEASSIRIEFEAPGGPCLCYFDDVRLVQVLDNIINNAIKYNKVNGAVTVRIVDREAHFEVHVSDTGKGIAPEDQLKVFDEFETLGKVALHHKGTGLGMPITKRLIEGMGGTIQLESEVGVGSNFWITVPKEKVLPEENYRTRDDAFDLAA